MKTLVMVLLITVFVSTGVAYAQGFTNESLQGTYGFKVTFGANEAVLLGVLTFDGNGKVTSGSGIMNAPAPLGRRKTIEGTIEGTYAVNSDGTGSATYVLTTSDGLTLEVNYYAVIMQAQEINGLKLVTELFAVQREAGNPLLAGKLGSLVAGEMKRLPD